MKKHTIFFIFFSLVTAFFLWDVLFLRAAFLEGDYANQFYPWSWIYAESLKTWTMPFWSRFFHSGFPLAAEGQTGVFYPMNMLFFKFIPFKAAYNYIVVLHFFLAGIFTYIYTRRMGAGVWGGSLAAILFCFGSAYAGCFYNTVTVKTLIWFPLGLYLLERYFNGRRPGYLLWLGLVAGMQFLAGFAQLALYSMLFYTVYYVTGLIVRKEVKARDICGFTAAVSVAVLIFLPQLLLSLPLVAASMRADTTLGFALWGSFPPLNLMSLVFPSWIFQGTRFYISVFGLFFMIAGIIISWRNRKRRPLLMLLFLSFFLALGKFNPLYVLLLKLSGIYSFRNPSKFLFFGMFAAAVISGGGFSRFFGGEETGIRKKTGRIFTRVVTAFIFLFFAAKTILSLFGERILGAGEWYARNYIYGRAHHRYSLDTYMSKVHGLYEAMLTGSSLNSPYIASALVLCALGLIFAWYVRGQKRLPAVTRSVVLAVILADLYVFSLYGTGFRGNLRGFDHLEPERGQILEVLRNDKSRFRILPFDIASGRLPNWSKPNLNAVFGLDSIAAYSPLVTEDYHDALEGLECIDSSLGMVSPSPEVLSKKRELLRAMNVKYVVSARE
ncbi:MAG: hypothetical protein GF392_02005, partial [Candidatus Omnitrophica bacterium]|nr:hypothetical protein [Candidatus Omnitrophota bacterium]